MSGKKVKYKILIFCVAGRSETSQIHSEIQRKSQFANQDPFLTVTSGDGVAPPAVRLADRPVGGAGEGHPLLAPEGHHRVERRPAPLQPAVGQDPGRPAVDF